MMYIYVWLYVRRLEQLPAVNVEFDFKGPSYDEAVLEIEGIEEVTEELSPEEKQK